MALHKSTPAYIEFSETIIELKPEEPVTVDPIIQETHEPLSNLPATGVQFIIFPYILILIGYTLLILRKNEKAK